MASQGLNPAPSLSTDIPGGQKERSQFSKELLHGIKEYKKNLTYGNLNDIRKQKRLGQNGKRVRSQAEGTSLRGRKEVQ